MIKQRLQWGPLKKDAENDFSWPTDTPCQKGNKVRTSVLSCELPPLIKIPSMQALDNMV